MMLDVLRRAALLAAREVLAGCVVALGGQDPEENARALVSQAQNEAAIALDEAARAMGLARENEVKLAAISAWASDAVAEADALRNGVEEKHRAPEENCYVSIGLVPTRALVAALGPNVEAAR